MHCAHLIQTPPKTNDDLGGGAGRDRGYRWSFAPMEAVERGRNAVSEMRESWRTSERKDGGRRWTTRFLGEEEGWSGD